MSVLIACQNASFGYDAHVVVSDLSFNVRTGDYLCIVGENGSGKSTLVKGLLRLLAPMRGTVTYGTDAGVKIEQKTIGYLSQQAAAKKDFPAGVLEIVLSGNLGNMGLRPFYSHKEKQAAEENIVRLGIADLKKRCYRELSGGQQRRVLLARALCAAHRVLMLDEPAAGLDPIAATEMYALLKKINQEVGMSIIMVSHDIEAAASYASHILHLKNKQCFYGSAEEYIQSAPGKEFLGRV
jgi:zinc transport system ATP-binding protein